MYKSTQRHRYTHTHYYTENLSI
uniref:Uncharacterized protein n=1 Tax=Rhizophora mucronata TaxID=61149 RepID=A0A2P2Q5W0_RHIMU